MTNHVVLVGLMGSGKSTVGRRLAGRLDRPFVDADAVLEEVAHRSIAEIFEQDGEAGFRDLEAATFGDLVDTSTPSVIAGGGGLVLRAENRARLREPDVTVVYLLASPAFLARRVKPKPHRPLLQGDDPPRQVLTRLHTERAPWYDEVADITVSVEPFHDRSSTPKEALADEVARRVLAHETGVVA
jgi:shikimate kinase